jgi:hypothetical protein
MPNQEREGRSREQTPDELKVGDAVAYSRAFLQSIGAYTGDMPRAKGKLTGLVAVGRELVLADITWDLAELPPRVNVKNLCRVGSRAYQG